MPPPNSSESTLPSGALTRFGLEHAAQLFIQLCTRLVAMDRHCVLSGGEEDLVLFPDDRQRTVRVTRESTTVSNYSAHGSGVLLVMIDVDRGDFLTSAA